MADCSKTEVFFEEWNRLCRNAPSQFFCTGCECQKLFESYGYKNCAQMMRHHAKELIEFVQQWSDEHPEPKPKTYADVFFEKFPNAKRHENGRPLVYRCDVYGCECNYKKAPEVIYWRGKQGIDDCLTCWNEPYKED